MSITSHDWDKLLCEKRERNSKTVDMERNGFEKDYDRIISSSSLRRLQDKAQVFPLQSNDFTRTRLTHSLEASALGRSLGTSVARRLIESGKIADLTFEHKVSSLLAVACLVHDIGNPPFGHYGETVIQHWFKNWFESPEFYRLNKDFRKKNGKPILTEPQRKDFELFEGNAQGLRILSRLQFLNDQHGINFTYGTLAALIKYPCSSLEVGKKYKKYGYFDSEKKLFSRICANTGIGSSRHPLTLLVEAADDIAYLAADVEDGVKKGVVAWEQVYQNVLKPSLEPKYEKEFKFLEEYRKTAKENDVPGQDLINAQNFRIWAQGAMVKATVAVFIAEYDHIMKCEYDGSLLEDSTAGDIAETLREIGIKHCYCAKEVLSLELVGDSVIKGLLNLFVDAIAKPDVEFKPKTYSGKLFHHISSNFRYVHKFDASGNPTIKPEELGLYEKLQLITDYISGMTDSYAVDLFQKLTGVKLP